MIRILYQKTTQKTNRTNKYKNFNDQSVQIHIKQKSFASDRTTIQQHKSKPHHNDFQRPERINIHLKQIICTRRTRHQHNNTQTLNNSNHIQKHHHALHIIFSQQIPASAH